MVADKCSAPFSGICTLLSGFERLSRRRLPHLRFCLPFAFTGEELRSEGVTLFVPAARARAQTGVVSSSRRRLLHARFGLLSLRPAPGT